MGDHFDIPLSSGPFEEPLIEAGRLERYLTLTKERIAKAHADAIAAAEAEKKKKADVAAAQGEKWRLAEEARVEAERKAL